MKAATPPRRPASFFDYPGFMAKFEPKKTTDDCYTPPPIMDAITQWAKREYAIPEDTRIMRPFFPGGNYESEDYTGAIVIDNPPFSMLASILDFYQLHGVKFFLFAPKMTIFSTFCRSGLTAVIIDADIPYSNGANVATSFITNLTPDTIARTAPELETAIDKAAEECKGAAAPKSLPTYRYPQNVITSTLLAKLSAAGIAYQIPAAEARHIAALQDQKAHGKTIFGSGLLVSTAKAAEAKAAEAKAAQGKVIEWQLSPMEKMAIAQLDKAKED